jgi:hypothetical protein
MQESERHDQLLTGALRALARQDAALGASPDVEARLLAEVRALRRVRRRASVKLYAMAAALLAALALPVWQLAGRAPALPPAAEEIATEFFPLMYSTVPVTSGHVVRMEVPETVMASFGLRAIGAGPRDTVLADVMVGDDGLARAVRFVVTPQEEPQ